MKIRIKENSIRFRLSRSEVDKFAKETKLEETTSFINTSLKYAIEIFSGEVMHADFSGSKITMYIPGELANKWVTTDMVGIDFNMPLDENNHLYLLIEKDFKCRDMDPEGQSDYFTNPMDSC